MAVTLQLASLVPSTQLTTAPTMLFGCPAGTFVRIDRLLVANPTAAAATVSIWLVPPGQSTGNSSLTTPTVSIPAYQTWSSPNETGHVLQPGASLWASASAASTLNLTASGIMSTGT